MERDLRGIRVTSCYKCPWNLKLDIYQSPERRIKVADHCVTIEENVAEYSKNKTFHPNCQLRKWGE